MISRKMMARGAFTILGFTLMLVQLTAQSRRAAAISDPAVQMITGPYTHRNLSVFLLHGREHLPGKHFLTLGEALAQKKAIVYETSQVNELAVENLSNEEIYIQSGDIVKGGKQDRTLGYDLILRPHSGKIKVTSFCVEQGRWRPRGNEAPAEFDSSEQRLSSKDLKLAAVQKNDQGEVWRNVTAVQDKLTSNLAVTVNSAQSPSSLPLAMENQKVKSTVAEYMKPLLPIVERKQDVIGFAFAINGVVNSADVYASHELFLMMWPKLLKASAVEAIAELAEGRGFETATPAMVSASIKDAEKGKRSEKIVSPHIRMVTNETERNLLFETQDQDQWIHKSYIQK